jgi:hypothetical protein
MHSLIDLERIPRHNSPIPFWFWNGAMDAGEIRRQMALLRDAGISEFIIHGRYGLKTEYLSDAWFDAVGAAVAEAAKTGMRAWIYDELNWPSGSAGGKVTRDRSFCEHHLDADGRLRLTETATDASPDYLSAKATKKFIAHTHAEYWKRFRRHFGRTIPGFFNDEVRFANARPWSASLGPKVPSGAAYHRAVGKAIAKNYFRVLSSWCGRHKARMIGHVMGEETLGSNGRYMSDIFSCLEEFHEPGIDHLGPSAEGFQHRPGATAGRLLDRPVTCETGGGFPWDFTVSDLYRVSGWLFANGVTRLVLHGFFYDKNPEDWPPDMFFRWQGWPEMGTFVDWATRVQHFLSVAKPVRRVALYYPLEEFRADFAPDPAFTLNFMDKGPVIAGPGALRLHLGLQELSSALYARNIDFDLVPAPWFGKVKDSVLIAPSGTKPAFRGRLVSQEGRTAEETVRQVEELLGPRPGIRGPGAAPGIEKPRANISDPYIHSSGDTGGVLVREYLLGGRKAWLIWNACSSAFAGTADLPGTGPCVVLDPAEGTERSADAGQGLSVSLKPFSMNIVVC